MDEASRYFDEAKKLAPDEETLNTHIVSYTAVTGDVEAFFIGAARAMESRDLDPQTLRYAWWLDKVRSDSRYAELLKRVPS